MQVNSTHTPLSDKTVTSDHNAGDSGNHRLGEIARQFESLLVEQVLKSMRESGSGWLGSGEDESNAAVMQLGEEQLAQALSSAGGLGFGKLVISGLEGRK